MKKFFFFLFLIIYLLTLGQSGRVAVKAYDGNCNDLYLIAFNGYYLPLIADGLNVDDNVIYYSFYEWR